MSLTFLIILAVIRYLQKTLDTAKTLPQWHKKFTLLSYLCIAGIALQIFVEPARVAVAFAGYTMLGWMLYLLLREPVFKNSKFLFLAVLPYLVASFLVQVIKLVSDSFYAEWFATINTINTAAVVWGVGVWLVTNRQQKELVKARARTLEEESNNKVITAVKARLEVEVAERTAELTRQKNELEVTLEELKATQAQLIHSEKMASLGELTAGIAHEIQNPLNFVNNFSEVSNELIDEMQEEIAMGNYDEAKAIAADVKQNLDKINFHGKRADAIVKGMLQHSRKSTGVKELTDINALSDEYLRLCYHGLRAKDKSFNAAMRTDFDPSIPKINIISQDIGRVILNLLTNAFYAVNEKKQQHPQGYDPTVSISTKSLGDQVEISISDNGNGIPQQVMDKIFQPFFTTKPSGQGTGLGLSLSYDIVTKGHGGELKVSTREQEGTSFRILLPF